MVDKFNKAYKVKKRLGATSTAAAWSVIFGLERSTFQPTDVRQINFGSKT